MSSNPVHSEVYSTILCDKVCQWLATGRWFSPGTLVSSTNKTDCQNITEILSRVVLNTINQPSIFSCKKWCHYHLYMTKWQNLITILRRKKGWERMFIWSHDLLSSLYNSLHLRPLTFHNSIFFLKSLKIPKVVIRNHK